MKNKKHLINSLYDIFSRCNLCVPIEGLNNGEGKEVFIENGYIFISGIFDPSYLYNPDDYEKLTENDKMDLCYSLDEVKSYTFTLDNLIVVFDNDTKLIIDFDL